MSVLDGFALGTLFGVATLFLGWVAEAIIRKVREKPEGPQEWLVQYDADGDILEVVRTGVSYYGKYQSPALTVFVGQEGEGVVGFCVEGASKIARKPFIYPANPGGRQ